MPILAAFDSPGTDRGAKATAFLDDLAQWLTHKIGEGGVARRVRVETISVENEAQYEYPAWSRWPLAGAISGRYGLVRLHRKA